MTADVELLPLPSVLLNWPHPTNHAAIRDYARANVLHHTAAQAAEIEALREQLDWMVQQNDDLLNEGRELTARAERLAEALREIEQHALARGNGDLLQFVRAALHPTAAQENGDV